jgi:hypothetical protein
MQIRKTYQNVKPELLYEEIKELATKHGTVVQEAKLYTSAAPGDTSSFISRGVMTFTMEGGPETSAKECMTVHLLGSDKGETKVIFNIDEKLFPQERLSALESDLDFIFSSYQVIGR